MNTYTIELDEPVGETAERARAWLSDQPKPPFLDVHDGIVWFEDEEGRASFEEQGDAEQDAALVHQPRLGWSNGRIQLVMAGQEVTDAVQQQLISDLAKGRSVEVRDEQGRPVEVDRLFTPPA